MALLIPEGGHEPPSVVLMHPSEWADLSPSHQRLYAYRGGVGRLAMATHRAGKVQGLSRADISAAIRGTNHSPAELDNLRPLREKAEKLRASAYVTCSEADLALVQQEAIATAREEWTCIPPSDETLAALVKQLAAINPNSS